MKYSSNTALGDAGEFLFAFKIASVLKWPCRLFDIDIGVDAQVEVLDGEQSTGRFVAFQIKTSTVDHRFSRYVKKRQLSYWRGLGIPVFAVLVDLKDQTMYLHRIDKAHKYHVTEKGEIRIDFDRAKDLFNESSGDVIRDAAEAADLSEVRRYLQVVRNSAVRIREQIAGFDEYPNPELAIELMRERFEWRKELAQAETLAKSFGVGKSECADARIELESSLEDLRSYMDDEWDMTTTWDDERNGDGDIKRFIAERYS